VPWSRRSPLEVDPTRWAVGAGFVWASNLDDRTLLRIDPKTLRVTKTVGLGFEPTDLAGDRNHVWVVGGYDYTLWRIDADGEARLKLEFTERLGPLPSGFERGPAGVAVHGTSVWLSHGDELTELDADSGEVRRTVRAGGRWHREIATDGSRVWVGYNDATRPTGAIPNAGIDPVEARSGETHERIELVSDASELVFESGQLWVLIRVTGSAAQLDPMSGLLQRSVPVGYWPEGLVFDGISLWITNEKDGTLRRVDPQTAETTVIPVGYEVEGVALADGRLFVAVRGP
jgi:hypothetical protein